MFMSKPLKILFVIRTYRHIYYYRSILDALVKRGHKTLLLCSRGLTKGIAVDEIKALEKQHGEGVDFDWAKEYPAWGTVIFHVRELLSYRNYLLIEGRQSKFYENRWKGYLHPKLQLIFNWSSARLLLKTGTVGFLLNLFELLTPPKNEVVSHLKSFGPDIVVASPVTMRHSSPDLEYLKAALKLGIPTVTPVRSWDSLTTKGTFHVYPDRLLVWNEAQKAEAILHHRFDPQKICITGSQFFDIWFTRSRPATSREEFCKKYGLRPQDLIITYLGSSINIAKDETPLVYELRKRLDEMDDPGLKNVQIIVRPHPLHYEIYEGLTVRDTIILPKTGALPDTEKNLELCYDTFYHSILVLQGINTSAVIDAMIVDCPVASLLRDEYKSTQAEAQHFQYFLNEKVMPFIKDGMDLRRVLEDLGKGKDIYSNVRKNFVRKYIRPLGFNRSVGEIMVEEIENFARTKEQ